MRGALLTLLLPLAGGVVENLYDDTIEDRVQEAEVLGVMFYSPTCGNSQAFAPAYQAAELELRSEGIPLARINAVTESIAAKKYDVVSMPKLVLFSRGAGSAVQQCTQAPHCWVCHAMSAAPRRMTRIALALAGRMMHFGGLKQYEKWETVTDPKQRVVDEMRKQAELARMPNPTTLSLAWGHLANELALLGLEKLGEANPLINTITVNEQGNLMISEAREMPPYQSHDAGGNPRVPDYHDKHFVVVSIPTNSILTQEKLKTGVLKHFLEAPDFQKHLRKQGLKLPSHFFFAIFVLYQRFAAGREYADPLWQAWLNVQRLQRTGQHGLYFWTNDELRKLEEDRLYTMAIEGRAALTEQFEKLLVPLCNMFPYFLPPEKIGEADYARAVAMVAASLVPIPALPGHSLLPLPLRQSPHGSVIPSHVAATTVANRQHSITGAVEDINTEVRQVNMVHSVLRGMAYGAELVFKASERFGGVQRYNDQLLLEAGYIWDDIDCAAVPLRFEIKIDAQERAGTRRKLMNKAKLEDTYDWSVNNQPVPEQLLLWSRIMLATPEELDSTDGDLEELLEVFQKPLSLQTESEIVGNLLQGMEKIYARYDHSNDEDELILEQKDLAVRERMAVQHRRMSKIVLVRKMEELNGKLVKREQQDARQKAGKNSYSTSSEQKRMEKAKAKKEKKRAKQREKWAEKAKQEL